MITDNHNQGDEMNAQERVNALKKDGFSDTQIRDYLCDGEALSRSDLDQETVEEMYDIVNKAAKASLERILEKAYIQEWFSGTDSFDGMIDCIIDAYPLYVFGCSRDDLSKWVKGVIDDYNDDASDQDKLVW